VTARLLPRLDEDTRLIPILDNLSQGFLAGMSSEWANASGSENTNEINAEMVDELAQKDFPLCMRMHHENLQRDKHLKHFGRLEYGLFLKVCYFQRWTCLSSDNLDRSLVFLLMKP
jgi:DNA primase large subunit